MTTISSAWHGPRALCRRPAQSSSVRVNDL